MLRWHRVSRQARGEREGNGESGDWGSDEEDGSGTEGRAKK